MTKVKSKISPYISATIIADSISSVSTKRIISYELEYPRYIHAELMTHRLFSRNAASSRAIPVKKKLSQIWNDPVIPIKWGKNKPGMQSSDEFTGKRAKILEFAWRTAAKAACVSAWTLSKLGLHKQWAGRLLEPFEKYKVVLTSTEFENWFWLRDHKDAQPEIRELAICMSEASDESVSVILEPGEWHLPYINTVLTKYGVEYWANGYELDLETAKQVSTSACAQVSYRVLDMSIEKAKDIFEKLITSVPVHASPCEHQATPMENLDSFSCAASGHVYEKGITHIKLNSNDECNLWSGNFCGWIQHRQLIPNNVKM